MGKNPPPTSNNKTPKNTPKKGAKNGNPHKGGYACEEQPKGFGAPPDLSSMKAIQLMKRDQPATKPHVQLTILPTKPTVDTFPMHIGNFQLQGGYELKLYYVDGIDNPSAMMATVGKHDRNEDSKLSCLMFRDTPEAVVRENVRVLIENLKNKKEGNSREPVNLASLPWLEKHHIFKLADKVDSFPDAVYYCDLCDYHINTIPHARTHLDPSCDARHCDEKERIIRREYLCQQLRGVPGVNQLAAIKSAINNIPPLEMFPEDEGTTTFHQYWANEVKTTLLDFLAEHPVFKGRKVVLELFGSVLVGCEFADSDINLYLDVEGVDDSDTGEVLLQFRDAVIEYRASQNLRGEVYYHDGPFPRISMAITEKNVRVVFAWKNKDAFKFSRILALYCKVQPKLCEFLRVVRYWAKKCDLFGPPGLNKHGFDLMVIHYLQITDKLRKKLTILHEIFDLKIDDLTDSMIFDEKMRLLPAGASDDTSSSEGSPSRNEFNLAALLVDFFCHYSKEREQLVQITAHRQKIRKETKWNNKIFQIQSPTREDNVVNFSKSFQPYFWNCILQTFVYFSVPRNKDGPVAPVRLFLKEPKKKKRDKANETPAKEAMTPHRTPKMAQHEGRWKEEGLKEGEDPAEFLMDRAEKALVESTKKKRIRRRKKGKEANKEEKEEDSEGDGEEEEETLGVEDFPDLTVDGILVEDLKPEDVEINDFAALQQSRTNILRICRLFALPSRQLDEMLYELNKFPDVLREEETPLPSAAEEQSIDSKDVSVDPPEEEGPVEEVAVQEEIDNFDLILRAREKVMSSKTAKNMGLCQQAENQEADNSDLIRRAREKVLSSTTAIKMGLHRQQADKQEIADVVSKLADDVAAMAIDNKAQEEKEEGAKEAVKDSSENAAPQPVEQAEEGNKIANDLVFPPDAAPQAAEPKTEEVEKVANDEFFSEIDDAALAKLKKASSWDVEAFDYTFEVAENFTLGYRATMKCNYCDSQKHPSDECPEMKIPEIEDISYEKTKEEWKELDDMILDYFHRNQLPIDRRNHIRKYVKDLEVYLQATLKGGRLDFFGSLENGFGGEKSDADLCFRFEADEAPEDKDGKEVIRTIDRLLRERRYAGFIETILVLTAKVPVVKFKVFRDRARRELDFEGDISYYNDLALYNTQLLATYCKWAPGRLPILGAWVKHWAKQLDIGDASKGSLSSYSYTIMTIYYLQNCDPPVLPNLQEDFRTVDTAREPRGEWDVYFHREVQKEWSENTQSVAKLFVGFLDFISRLDLNNLVIQIRRHKPMPKLEKKWNRSLSIEDPFDLSHNLGSGLSNRMYVHIIKSFIKSRAMFMKPDVRRRIKEPSYEGEEQVPEERRARFLEIYREALMKSCSPGKAPTDRLCHNCHRVGHFFENCPKRAEYRHGDNRKFDNRRRGGDFRRRDGKPQRNGGGFGFGNGRQQYKPNGGGAQERANQRIVFRDFEPWQIPTHGEGAQERANPMGRGEFRDFQPWAPPPQHFADPPPATSAQINFMEPPPGFPQLPPHQDMC